MPTVRDGRRRAGVVGVGLMGGSIGMALRARGWHVTGKDVDCRRAERALDLGALDVVGDDPEAEIVFVATPVGRVPHEAARALGTNDGAGEGEQGGQGSAETSGPRLAQRVVTDVGSVKAPIVSALSHPRFVGGHPMAGSEQEGVEGADPALFEGATWVLTPTAETDPEAYLLVRSVASSLGADVVAMTPQHHDALVAVVSHVPHLTAATLMRLAAGLAEEHATLLRLAAGGFRDMTRVAAGHPGIWPDICAENREAITATFDSLLAALAATREVVARGDRQELLRLLEDARAARVNLPVRIPRAENLIELRVPVPDRPGVLAEVTTLAGELGANIEDLEIAHSSEGDRGVLVVVVEATSADLLRGALFARGFRPRARRLE